jgi:hypothetical protein
LSLAGSASAIRLKESDPSHQARLSELTPADLAECLTLIEGRLFLSIRVSDCVFFLKNLGGDAAAAITDAQYKNEQVSSLSQLTGSRGYAELPIQLAAWVQKLVMKVSNPGDRAQKIAFFIAAANVSRGSPRTCDTPWIDMLDRPSGMQSVGKFLEHESDHSRPPKFCHQSITTHAGRST